MLPVLVCFYHGRKPTREYVDEEFSDEELFLTMKHRKAIYCEIEEDY